MQIKGTGACTLVVVLVLAKLRQLKEFVLQLGKYPKIFCFPYDFFNKFSLKSSIVSVLYLVVLLGLV